MNIGNEKKEENISFYDKITNEKKFIKFFTMGKKFYFRFFLITWIFPQITGFGVKQQHSDGNRCDNRNTWG